MKITGILKKAAILGVNAMAMALVVQSANSACIWVLHQPEFPKEAEKFKKV